MTRYKLTLEYDGTDLAGWQRQKDKLSVQELLEDAIYDFCQEKVQTQCAGRTDAGVHARGQVAHVDMETQRELFSMHQGINHHLIGKPLVLLGIESISDDFNARFDATKRYYRYHIIQRPAPLVLEQNRAWWIYYDLDVDAMREAAKHLIGQHDFTSFRAAGCQAKSPVKTLDNITITQEGESIFIDVEALSFLYHMVRNIVGNLVMVGKGEWQSNHIKTVLDTKDREQAGPTAPACGLYFMRVEY